MSETARILRAVGQASYLWDIESGKLSWSDNFPGLVGLGPETDISSSRAFDRLLSSESHETRFAAVQASADQEIDEDGCCYQCTYAINPDHLQDKETVWLEDTGRWYPDDRGRPQRAEGIVRIVNDRRKNEDFLKRRSDFDDLTGLPNRRFLQERIGETISNGLVNSESAAFAILALCDFERVNEVYGFSVGDEVLEIVAGKLSDCMREKDLTARFSGAKFGLIFNKCQTNEIFVAARRIMNSVNDQLIRTSKGPVSLRLAMGACLLPHHARQPIEAVSAASDALDRARRERGLRLSVHDPDPEIHEHRLAKSRLLSRFVDALEEGRLQLAFQPVVDADSRGTVYHEALLRIDDCDDGIVEDAGFIKLAEDLGLMRLVDMHALELVMAALKKHRSARLSLNATHESLNDGDWLSALASGLAYDDDVASRLTIEVTESQIPNDISETAKCIRLVQEMGCQVAIDDFGAGYTSFSHLKDLAVDIVKIDGSFCRDLKKDPRNGIFLKAMQDLASTFDVKTVVEWVEDENTASRLKNWGFDFLQGGLFGMPNSRPPWESSDTSLVADGGNRGAYPA